MKVIAISNQKGGVGKTTTSINLSASLASLGKRILLVDVDPQGNATSIFGLKGQGGSLYEALIEKTAAQDLILPTRIPNLHIITANLDLAGAEVEVARMDNHLFQLRRALDNIRKNNAFDFVILDCPPSLGILMSNALVAADEILLPIQCEYYALEGLGLLVQVSEQLRQSGANPSMSISGMVMTMFDARTRLNTAVVQDVREHFREVVYQTVIPRTVRFGEAPSHSKTILEYDPLGVGAQAYQALAKEFLERQAKNISFINSTQVHS
jgi:chromosome partitioning protein